MALREKFGRLVLLEQTDSDPLGDEYSAARLGPGGLDRLVNVLRFSPAVSGHAEASKRLVEEARLVSQLQNPGLVRLLGVGRVGQSFYVSSELAEGRTVRAVLRHCSEEGFPFAVDHALMIASRAAAGLEYLHGRKDQDGHALVHGLLTPGRLVVAFDGEVKVKGLGLWPALGAMDLLAPEECLYLAPEQAAGATEPRSDVYALGLVLLEALCGQPPDGSDPLERVAAARIASPGGEPTPLPKPLTSLLRRALGREPAARFAGIAEMRKAIDALLFSGDFTPTTFDLAFFMHTLFRDEVERDARVMEEARSADYQAFLTEDVAKPAGSAPPQTEPLDAHAPVQAVTGAIGAMPTAVQVVAAHPEALRVLDAPAPPGPRPAPGPDSSGSRHARASHELAAREAAAREAAARSAPGVTVPRRGVSRSLWLALGLIGAVVIGGGAGWLYLVAQQRAAASEVASAAQAAAQAHVRELEARIGQLEREKAEAETKAAEEARAALEKQSAAAGQKADPAAIARAQEQARQRARAEQERKQQEELARLAEAKKAEEQRLAAATPPPTPLPSPTPPQATSAPAVEQSPAAATVGAAAGPALDSTVTLPQPLAGAPTPAPGAGNPSAPAANGAAATPPGTRQPPADPSDPAVRPPGLISEDPVPYPARAVSRRIAAVVVVRALVDENGRISEATIIQASGQLPEYGFDQAALNRVKSRKYRPARRNDVPVSFPIEVRVEFRPPPIR